MKTKTWLLVIIFAISIISIVVGIYYSSLRQPPDEGKDLFGIDEIYPTKEGGREWFIDMGNPFSDDIFSSTFDRQLTQQEDGSWRIGGPAVRLNVNTPSNTEPWKNVEITGYAKVIESTSLAPLSNSDTFDDRTTAYCILLFIFLIARDLTQQFVNL